jgi:hypothetical protein
LDHRIFVIVHAQSRVHSTDDLTLAPVSTTHLL